jgi:hypothetical protein
MGILLITLSACYDDNEEPRVRRTIIAYLAGDNSLNSYMKKNIADMQKSMKQKNGRLVVYFDGSNAEPELFEIVPTSKDTAKRVRIATYPEENSADPATMRRVLDEVKALYPADSYGLVLGSHATGWVPKNASITAGAFADRLEDDEDERPLTRTFGDDAGAQMDAKAMAEAIPGGFEFIFFDACMMSSIEVLYELRGKTKYVIATPTEILAAGFPYEAILPDFWGNANDLQKACEYFYNMLDKNDRNYFASIALLNIEELDALYSIARGIFQGKKETVGTFPASAIFHYPLINIRNDVYFDLRDFAKYAATDEQLQQFDAQLAKVVLYQNITNPFYATPIPDKSRACGISTYIPLDAWPTWNLEYDKLSWAGIYQ